MIERLRITFLYFYFFSLSIENWSPWGGGTELFRPALIFAMLYVSFSFFNFSKNFKLINTKKIVYPAITFWSLITLTSLIYSFEFPQAKFSLNYTLLACIISFWLISNDLNQYTKLKNHFLIIILFNGVFLSLLSFFQIGIDIGYMGRQSLLGNNPNIIGLQAVISVLIIIVILIDNPHRYSKRRFFLVFFLPLLLQIIAKTGSKGALILLMSGMLFYFLLMKKQLKIKVPLLIIGVFVSAIIFQYLLQNDVLAARWSDFVETGNTTGRTSRWLFALKTFLDNPMFGVGENGFEYIPSPFFDSNDPHNVYIYVLATGGLFSFIPFVILLIRIAQVALRNWKYWNTVLPVIMLIILLIHWFKAGGGLNSKLVWAYFALITYSPNIKKYKT